MAESKTDALLREFLEAEALQRSKGITLESLHRAVQRLADDRFSDRLDDSRYRARVVQLERQMAIVSSAPGMTDVPDFRPDPREITGQFDLVDIKRRVEEQERKRADSERVRAESATWWKRQGWTWTVGTLLTLLVATIVGCVGYVATHLPPPVVQPK